MAALLRLHPPTHLCPRLRPPHHPHLRRHLVGCSIPFQSASSTGGDAARARNPPRPAAAVGGAEFGEQRRRVGEDYDGGEEEDLGQALERTRQLVECAMFASVAGLAYFLSNSLAIENYFSCFFPLPIVISSLRWGLQAGRKTVVATVLLLFTLSGPTRALGACGYVLLSSFLIRENILALLLLNCGFFIFLLHIMYTVFLTKLGIKPSLRPPRWLDKAI
uniref:Uncharacterized protein n=1 Tax=Leersia perrieri TaxID=77586 RepID=A0A0D9VFF1_9ORYZ